MPKYKNQRELDEELEDTFEEADREVEAAPEKKEKTDWESRYSHLRRHQSQTETALKSQIDTLTKQIENLQSGSLKPPKTREEINRWKESYPEFSEVLESWIKAELEENTKEFKKTTKELEREKAFAKLRKLHPDFEEILDPNNTKFHEWMADRKDVEKKVIYNSLDVENAAFIIDKYKAVHGEKKKKNEDSNDFDDSASRSVRTRSNPKIVEDSEGYMFSESQIEALCRKDPNWWDANEEKVFAAQRAGKIKLDLTGGSK